MIRVLFVCLGNICRSPMAEAVFRDLVKKEGLEDKFTIDSAGLGDWHIGHPPHQGTREILDKYKIPYDGMVARKMKEEDLDSFDYIIAMDDDNMAGINGLKSEKPNSFIAKLTDFIPEMNVSHVPDPYYTGNFDYVYELVTKGCQALLDHIKENHFLTK